MARPRTTARVHAAVLTLVGEQGYPGVTMGGSAARAGVSKQTLYRTWSSTADILFDALRTANADPDGRIDVPDTGDLAADLVELTRGTVAELSDPATDRILRAVTAEIQADPVLGVQLRDQLLAPQLAAIAARFRLAGVSDPDAAVELLLGPLFHRWLLRTRPFEDDWPDRHVARVLRAVRPAPAELIARRRHLPTVDPDALRRDLDEVLDA